MSKTEVHWPVVPCCSAQDDLLECACGKEERALRNLVDWGGALTSEQREWCLTEIDSVEGYSRTDYEHEADHHLARGVLSAWRDYCRDKGLLL